MNKKILILGNGFIASEFTRSYSPYLYNFDPESLVRASDSSSPEYINSFIQVPLSTSMDDRVSQHFDKIQVDYNSILEVINKYHPDVVINCIGKTGKPNVDWCETHQDETVEANLVFPSLLARICNKKSIHLIHIGSGCINYGPSPQSIGIMYEPGWKESDSSNPKSFYSKVKYAADLALSGYDNVTIFRIRMPISPIPNSRNLITKLLGYKKVIQEPNSMTFTIDVLNACKWAIDNRKTGIYNLAHEKPLTAFDIVKEYSKYNSNHQFERLSLSELSSFIAAPRSNCILDCSKIRSEGFIFSDISIDSCIRQYINNENMQKR